MRGDYRGSLRGRLPGRRVLLVFLGWFIILTQMGSVQVMASGPEVQEQYAKAVEGVKGVIEVATKSNVRPLRDKCEGSLEPGVTDIKDILAAVRKGLYVEIINSKKNVNMIPDDYADYRNIFLAIISNYEDAIYDGLEKLININEKDTKQGYIIIGREISKDFEIKHKDHYSLRLDKLQEKVFIKAKSLIGVAKNTKSESAIRVAEAYIKDMKEVSQEFLNDEIYKVIKELESALKKVKNMIKVDKIINMESIELHPNDVRHTETNNKSFNITEAHGRVGKEQIEKLVTNKLSITLPSPVPREYDLYITFQWINEVFKKEPTLENIKASYAYTRVQGNDKTRIVDMPLVKTKDGKEVPVQGNYLIYLVNKETGAVDFTSKNPIKINLGVESSTVNYKNKSVLKINTEAKASGYITHEIRAKYKNRYIKEDVLIEAGDTPKIIGEKIKKCFKEISSYMKKTTMEVKDGELIIETWESEEITHRVQ